MRRGAVSNAITDTDDCIDECRPLGGPTARTGRSTRPGDFCRQSAAAVAQALRAQYPNKVDDIRIAEMLAIARRALERERPAPDSSGAGRPGSFLPCTVIVLDEIQQYINEPGRPAPALA